MDLRNDIYRVHGDLASRITGLHEVVSRNEGHGTINVIDAPPEVPQVPNYLEDKFDEAIRIAYPELQDDKNFPLVNGITAFHQCFEQVSLLASVTIARTELISEEHLEIST